MFNQIAKARHMFGGDIDMPLVLRTKVAMGTGYGSQHSLDPAGIFATSPGWRIVAPSTPFDYIGLMNTAIARTIRCWCSSMSIFTAAREWSPKTIWISSFPLARRRFGARASE